MAWDVRDTKIETLERMLEVAEDRIAELMHKTQNTERRGPMQTETKHFVFAELDGSQPRIRIQVAEVEDSEVHVEIDETNLTPADCREIAAALVEAARLAEADLERTSRLDLPEILACPQCKETPRPKWCSGDEPPVWEISCQSDACIDDDDWLGVTHTDMSEAVRRWNCFVRNAARAAEGEDEDHE